MISSQPLKSLLEQFFFETQPTYGHNNELSSFTDYAWVILKRSECYMTVLIPGSKWFIISDV